MELILGDYGIQDASLLFLIIPATLVFYHYIKKEGMNRRKWFFLASRFMIISLIVLAIAAPFIANTTKEYKEIADITILLDRSESMNLTDSNIELAERLHREISSAISNLTGKPASVELKYFSEGNRTAIGDALYQETLSGSKAGGIIILLSDGNNNYGRDAIDTAGVLAASNATILAVVPNTIKEDIYVASISGDEKTPANADYTLKVEVGKTGTNTAQYHLELKVDDALIHVVNGVAQEEKTKTFSFTFAFKNEGLHKITIKLRPITEDYIKENNEMSKSVEVVKRPKILLVTSNQDSLLAKTLKQNYEVHSEESSKQNYSKYDAVYFDNVPGEDIDYWVTNTLHNYVVNGNGLVVVGGENAYERSSYHTNQIETLLPVISTEPPEKRRKEMSIIFLIDVSESTGYSSGRNTKVDVEKALAINILRQLDDKDYVAAIAFNVGAYTISPLKKVSEVRTELENKIRSLTFVGGTDMKAALTQADLMLDDSTNMRYVIIISDGVINRLADKEPTLGIINSMKNKGVTVHAIGVGFDTDENFMRMIAKTGGGLYFKPEEYERLKLEFEEKGKEKKDQYTLSVYNKYHFITRDLKSFVPSITDFNGVTEKSVAQVLVVTEGKMPIVTAWRFGLGRVVALTVDNGNKWAPNVYYSNNGELISAITNWVIGDLEKNKRVNINSFDVSVGEKAEFKIKSDKEPSVFIQDPKGKQQRVTLKQTDINMFEGSFSPQEPGYYIIKATSSLGEDTAAVAVDIPQEYRNLGVDADALKMIASATGGKTYNINQIPELESAVLDYTKKSSYKETLEKKPLQTYFMAAALGLFFIDVVSRRILDIIRLRRRGE